MKMPYQPQNSSALLNLQAIREAKDTPVHVAFVDPIFSVKYLSRRLREAGIKTSAIYTMVESPNDHLPQASDFFDFNFHVANHQDLSMVATYLQGLKVDYIFYGSESSIQITDILANMLTPDYANCLSNSNVRGDKFVMQDVLLKNGINILRHAKINKWQLQELEPELNKLNFPVLCKAITAMGAANIKLCRNIADVKASLMNEEICNIFGPISKYFEVQEYVRGREFIVDTFSINGQHHVSGIQHLNRIILNNSPISLYSELVCMQDEAAKVCLAFAKRILEYLGLKNGFCHIEILLGNDGPVLMELCPRLTSPRGISYKLFSLCGYASQIDLLIASSKNEPLPEGKLTQYGRKVFLQNYQERRLNALNLALLYTLPSFKDAAMNKRPGSLAALPSHMHDTVGYVLLIHSDPRQIEADYQQLMEWESNLELF